MPEPVPRRPRSPAQIAAARANGARSRGPASAEGKARASRNALRHGLCATVHLLVPGEDPAALEALREALSTEFACDRPSRALLLERLVAAAWKLRRAERLEAALHALPPRPAFGRVDPEPGLPSLLTRLPEYAALLRHQGQLERSLWRTLWLLEAPVPADSLPVPLPLDPPAEPAPTEAPPGDAQPARDPPAECAHATGPQAEGAEAADEAPATAEAAVEPPEGAPPDRFEPAAADGDAASENGRVVAASLATADGVAGPAAEAAPPEPSGDAADAPSGAAEALADLARGTAHRLLQEGRMLEAARLARLFARPGREGRVRRPPPPFEYRPPGPGEDWPPPPGLTPEELEAWHTVGYPNWVVPPGTGRRPLASLTNEWVCPADRWRVLEELLRVDDPAERERVLGHFARAGLDPGDDHPAYRSGEGASADGAPARERRNEPEADAAGAAGPPRPADGATLADGAAASAVPAAEEARDAGAGPDGPGAEPPSATGPPRPPGRDPALAALLVRLGEEADDYHAIGRARRAREAWFRHARELGVPVPPHADLSEPPGW